MKKTLIALMTACALAAVPAGIQVFAADTGAAAAEEGQNPVMNFIGKYGAGRATILVEAEGSDRAKVMITWGSSAWEHSEWEMSGPFDDETLTITYDDCVKKNVSYEDDSEEGTEEIVYENGTGTITFSDGETLSLTWKDDQEDIAGDTEFVWSFLPAEDMSEYPEDVSQLLADESSAGYITDIEIDNGVMTIRLEAVGAERDGFFWTVYDGDKGDASFTELLTETDMEEGFAYVGSFRGLDTGDDTIRLVHTNGFYVDEYMDFDVTVENGRIIENTGGSHAFPTSDEDLAALIEGVWQTEETPACFMEITRNAAGGFDVTVSDGGGRDGMTSLYTMTMYYDCLKAAFIYENGTERSAAITDGSEEAASEAASDSSEAGESGYVLFDTMPEEMSEDLSSLSLLWVKDPSTDGTSFTFVRAE
ncbi:MAG: hypothetical protein J6S83_05330 [Lachnospiraceae bacterium]|nr:hypothetical protein [Lachnospiraceae bacterium]